MRLILLASFLICLVRAYAQPIHANYPQTKKDTAVTDNYFGTIVHDPYRWLENDRSDETAEWVRQENSVTDAYLAKIPFRKAIHDRVEKILNYEKYSLPFTAGDYIYYGHNSGLQNQSVYYRQKKNGGKEELFLDPNTFSETGTTSLAGLSFTKDGSLAAYNISVGGSDWQKIVIMDTRTKKQVDDTIQDVKFSGASWKGNDGFYYSTYIATKEGSKLQAMTNRHIVYYHKIGTPQSADREIFGASGKASRYVTASVTEDQKWLCLNTSEETYGAALYVQSLDHTDAPIIPVVTDLKSNIYVVDANDHEFLIFTDRNAPNGKVVSAPLNDPKEENWKTVIPETKEVLNVSTAGNYLFASYLKDALTVVYQYTKEGKKLREIKLPGQGSAGGFSAQQIDKETYYSFASYIRPFTIYRLDLASGNSFLYRSPKIDFNPDLYESKQVFYTSKDGTRIPMMITYKKGIALNGSNPCLLYAYGGFNISLTPYFSTSAIILLENGGIYAVPNIRGGGEYGQEWHNQGIKLKKQNVFDDFIAAAQFLVDNHYTSRQKLAIEGGSNGGLLIGACMTQHPDMCRVAFPEVGVMDMLRYHKFTSGAGWAYDYGTSEDNKEMFDYLYHYSPVHNIRPAHYPATFITTADHDDRVVPAHSFKFAATMQEMQKGDAPVLIHIEHNAGHGAGMSTQQVIESITNKWSFMFYNLDVVPKKL